MTLLHVCSPWMQGVSWFDNKVVALLESSGTVGGDHHVGAPAPRKPTMVVPSNVTHALTTKQAMLMCLDTDVRTHMVLFGPVCVGN